MIKKYKSLAAILISVFFLFSGYSMNSYAAYTKTAVTKPASKSILKAKPAPTPAIKKANPTPVPKKTSPKPTATPKPTVTPLKQSNVFMWEVSPKDPKSTKKLYLLGSIHVGSEGNFPLDQRIEDAYSKSDALVVEADISKLTADKATEYITKYGVYAAPDTLKDKISSELYKKLGDVLQTFGVPMGPNIDAAKPWLLASQISSLMAVKSGYNPNLGIDMYFLNKTKDKKPIMELESADIQYQMLSGLSDKLQETFLASTLDSKDFDKSEIDSIYKYWKTGDTKNMEAVMFPPESLTGDMADLNDIVIYQRNIGMEKKIEEYLSDNTRNYFVVAGAAHMVGSKGIISLLINNGYVVKQV